MIAILSEASILAVAEAALDFALEEANLSRLLVARRPFAASRAATAASRVLSRLEERSVLDRSASVRVEAVETEVRAFHVEIDRRKETSPRYGDLSRSTWPPCAVAFAEVVEALSPALECHLDEVGPLAAAVEVVLPNGASYRAIVPDDVNLAAACAVAATREARKIARSGGRGNQSGY